MNAQDLNDQIPSDVLGFLENILIDAGITPIDETVHKQMIDDLYTRLDNFLTTVILENMPEEHLDQFTKMVDENKPKEEVEQFIKDNMPSADEVFAKAMVDFRDLYLGNTVVANPTTN